MAVESVLHFWRLFLLQLFLLPQNYRMCHVNVTPQVHFNIYINFTNAEAAYRRK